MMLKTKMSEFKNEPFLDFNDKAVQEKMYAAIANMRENFGKTYPLVINGEEIESKRTFSSHNPNNHAEVIGHFAKATQKQAEDALENAWTVLHSFPCRVEIIQGNFEQIDELVRSQGIQNRIHFLNPLASDRRIGQKPGD